MIPPLREEEGGRLPFSSPSACLSRAGMRGWQSVGKWCMADSVFDEAHAYALSSHRDTGVTYTHARAHTHAHTLVAETNTQLWVTWLSVSRFHEIGRVNVPPQRERERLKHEQLRFEQHRATVVAGVGGCWRGAQPLRIMLGSGWRWPHVNNLTRMIR